MAEEIKSGPARQWGRADETCCGVHASGNKEKPLVNACVLCPQASIYYAKEPELQARLSANPDAYPGFSAGTSAAD
jgi:hypothetical protein